MSALDFTLEAVHRAILDRRAEAASGLVRRGGRLSPEARLGIYIDAYRLRLVQAIRSDYPALLALLGDTAFDALALEYIEAHPPQSYNLDVYPHGFAAHVRAQCAADVFAGDLAALEGAIAEVFMMEESPALDPQTLAALTPEAWNALVLRPRAASRLLSASYPVESYLQRWRENGVTTRPEEESQTIFLVRHRHTVQRHVLGQGEHQVLATLMRGTPFGQAVKDAAPEALSGWIEKWLSGGFFRG